jgi:ABC-2 type transport system ATP-binding protein
MTKPDTSFALSVQNLKKNFGRKEVLRGISFSLPEGSIGGFLGANGAGKTTTIRALLGLISADSGQMALHGRLMPRERQAAMEMTGTLVESPRFIKTFSGFDNLSWFGGLTAPITDARIHEVLLLTGLSEAARTPFGVYSTGMKQRLGVALAILHRPKLLILDEPTNGMDPQGRAQIREILQTIHRQEGTTIFLSSHLLDEIQRLCDYVVIINKGCTVSEGRVDHLLTRERERWELRFQNADPVEVKRWLADSGLAQGITSSPLGFTVDLAPGTSGELNRRLLQAGFAVSALIPVEASLEETFLALTETRNEGPNA